MFTQHTTLQSRGIPPNNAIMGPSLYTLNRKPLHGIDVGCSDIYRHRYAFCAQVGIGMVPILSTIEEPSNPNCSIIIEMKDCYIIIRNESTFTVIIDGVGIPRFINFRLCIGSEIIIPGHSAWTIGCERFTVTSSAVHGQAFNVLRSTLRTLGFTYKSDWCSAITHLVAPAFVCTALMGRALAERVPIVNVGFFVEVLECLMARRPLPDVVDSLTVFYSTGSIDALCIRDDPTVALRTMQVFGQLVVFPNVDAMQCMAECLQGGTASGGDEAADSDADHSNTVKMLLQCTDNILMVHVPLMETALMWPNYSPMFWFYSTPLQ